MQKSWQPPGEAQLLTSTVARKFEERVEELRHAVETPADPANRKCIARALDGKNGFLVSLAVKAILPDDTQLVGKAEAAFERLLADRNHLGLLGEDLHLTTRRQLGNFPQAYSHLALIDTAMALGDATSGWDDDALIGHAAF